MPKHNAACTTQNSRPRKTQLTALVISFCILNSPFRACFADDNLPPQVDVAVARGLDHLARQQQPDGSFTAFDEPDPRGAPAAVAVIAFLSAGQTPLGGKHALVIHNAVEFLLRQLPDDGYFGRSDGSGMQGQAVMTIALAEVYGCENDPTLRPQIRPQLEKSLEVILKTQDRRSDPRAGGWAADGKGGEGDLVTTASVVLSLRALRDAGIKVPADAMERAARFARACAKPGQSLFTDPGKGPTAVSVASGVAILLLAEAATPGDLPDATRFLTEHRVDNGGDPYGGLYWDALASMLAGDPTWTAAWRPVRDALLSPQRRTEEGSWLPTQPQNAAPSAVQSTATAVMTLAMPYRLLPVYGR